MTRVRRLLFTRLLLALMVTSAGLQEAMSGSILRKDTLKGAQPVVLSQADMDGVDLGEWPKLLNITVSSTHTDGRWRGMTWHYLAPSSQQTGEVEPFEIHIVDGDDSELDNLHDTHIRNLGPDGNNDSAPDDLSAWTCEYVYRCVQTCLYAGAAISLYEIRAVGDAINTRLRADGNRRMLQLLGGQIVNFSVGLASGITGWYITNTIQKDPNGQDSCNDAKWEALINELRQDINDLGAKIQEGDCRSRVYDHYSEDPARQVEGRHLRHAVKAQKESSPAYSDPYCS